MGWALGDAGGGVAGFYPHERLTARIRHGSGG